jgi:beta-galactosidase
MIRRAMLLLLVILVGSASAGPKTLKFPKQFRWGTAISGFQSDMGVGAPTDPNTDWWVWCAMPRTSRRIA